MPFSLLVDSSQFPDVFSHPFFIGPTPLYLYKILYPASNNVLDRCIAHPPSKEYNFKLFIHKSY